MGPFPLVILRRPLAKNKMGGAQVNGDRLYVVGAVFRLALESKARILVGLEDGSKPNSMLV
jgi:hypothetical protein